MTRTIDQAAELGTDKWIVAPRLTDNHRSKGYTLALTPARYKALQDAWNAQQDAAKAERVALALFPREAGHMASNPDAWRVKIHAVRAALTAEGLLP